MPGELPPKMQKPPEIRRLAIFLDRRVLEQDGGDDQELAGKGDDARHAGFNDTHFKLPFKREPFRSRNASGRRQGHSQLQR